MGVISFDDAYAKPDKDDKKEKQTKLQKECAKDPKADDKIKAHCELLGLIDDSGSDTRVDSFFDVFFDVFTVDSFFDVIVQLQNNITELQTQSHDKYTDQEAIDAVGPHTGDTSALESRIAFLESRINTPPTITNFEINVTPITTPNSFGTTFIHECVIDYTYTVNDDKRWLPLTIEESTREHSSAEYSKTFQLDSLTFTEVVSNSFTYDYLNGGEYFRSFEQLTISVNDGEDTTIETQDFRC